MALLKAMQSKVTGIPVDQLGVKDTTSAIKNTPIQTAMNNLPVVEPSSTQKSQAQQRQDLITERAQINSRKVYNPEKTAENRARLNQIDTQLSTLTPDTEKKNRFKSGVQSILSTGFAALPVIGDTFSQLNKNTEQRANSQELDQLTKVNQQIRALEGARTGDALDYIRAQDQWKALDQERQALTQRLQGYMDTPVSADTAGMNLMRGSARYREQALEGLEGVPRFLGETALSIGQNAALLPTAAINPALPLVAMGTISAADKMYELNERGISPSEAITRGAASGLIEAATEKIPLDSLLGVIKTGGSGALRNILRQAGIEAGEESVSYVVNYIADKAAQDPEADFSLSELAQAAASGALSGGVFGTFGTAYNTLGQRSQTMDTIRANQADPDFNARSVENARTAVNSEFADRYGAYPQTMPVAAAEAAQSDFTPMPTVDMASVNEAAETLPVAREGILSSLDSGRKTVGDLSSAAQSTGNLSETTQALSSLMDSGEVALDAMNRLYRVDPSLHIDNRTSADVGSRSVNAFQFDNPSLHEYYVEAARGLLEDLDNSTKGERFYTENGVTGVKRSTTPEIAGLLDDSGLSYADIRKAAEAIIADHGQENYAVAKRVELVLDDMLTNGWTDATGQEIAPNFDYISEKGRLPGASTVEDTGEFSALEGVDELPQGLPVSDDGDTTSVGAAPEGFDQWSNFQNQRSQFFPEGANAARPVDVPTTDLEGRNIRKTASTAMGAKAIPDAVVQDIQNMVLAGKLSYDVNTDRASIDRAVQRIQADGFQRALGDFSNAVQKGVVSKDLATLGQQLLVNAANAGDGKATAELLSLYAQMETTAGQAVQAASILRKLDPTYQLYAAQKAVDNLNKTINKGKRNISSEDNVPVELWMQRVGENLADSLARRIKAPKAKIQTVSQTIFSDLKRFASETAPKQLPTTKKRTEMDRIMDLFQNKTQYNEAWQAAKDTLSDEFENDPDALEAFDEWLESSLDYGKMLTKELTGQTEIRIPDNLVEKFLQQTDQAGRDAVLDEIYQNIADQVPSTWKDKWNAWRYLAMLGNPRTHVRNIFGNAGFQPVRFTKDRIAAIIESAVSPVSGGKLQRTKSFAYSPDLYSAAWNDYNNVAEVLSGSKYDDVQSIINDRRTIFKTKPLEVARRANSNALSAEDAVFKRVTYAGALSGYLNANGVTAEQLRSGQVDEKLLTAARDYAGQEALKATYNDKNWFSDKVVQAARGLGTFGEAVLPFKRTPANILARGFEYSPLGLAKGLTYDFAKVKSGEMTAAQDIDNIASGLTGSALLALGAYLAAQGMVTGGDDPDEKQQTMNELTGGQSYALNLPGGGSVTLDWLAPEALPFFMGAQLFNSMGENGLTPESIMDSVTSVSEPMLEMSMLQSLNDLIDNVSYAASNQKLSGLVGSSLVSYLSQAFPTLGGQVERSGEDVRMSTYTDKTLPIPTDVQYAIGKVSAKLPGVDYQQIPYVDEWGRQETNGALPVRVANNFLNPAYTSQRNVTALDQEIQRLYDETGDGGVVPSRANRYITVDGERKDLTKDEYLSYATEKGQESYKIASSMIGRPAYKSLSDEEKAKAISDAYSYADAVAKSNVSRYEPDGWVKKAIESGVDAADYILYRFGLDDGMSLSDKSALMEKSGITGQQKTSLILSEYPDWEDDAKEAGVSNEVFVEFKIATSDLAGDKDGNGKTIPGSKKNKVLSAINAMDVDASVKDALYFASGYSANTIYDAPWR